ncbi:MAG: 50S ribosomal protein L3 [Spirochaetota bacterium]
MRVHIPGNKVGMTQIFDQEGSVVPVTVLKVGPCYVVDKKTEKRDGYNALVLGYGDVKEKKVRKPQKGLFQKAGIPPKKILKESKVSKQELDNFEIGQELSAEMFKKGKFVDVSGKTKGRGFSGVMKRHGMSGAKKSHGTHEYFRHGGSIGSSASPSRVFKGKKMPGRYGWARVTVQNLEICDIKPEKNIVLVKGAIPGPNKGDVYVAPAVKKPVS